MSKNISWIENDFKVELLALELKKLNRVDNEGNCMNSKKYLKSKLNKNIRKMSNEILFDQVDIIRQSISSRREKFKY